MHSHVMTCSPLLQPCCHQERDRILERGGRGGWAAADGRRRRRKRKPHARLRGSPARQAQCAYDAWRQPRVPQPLRAAMGSVGAFKPWPSSAPDDQPPGLQRRPHGSALTRTTHFRWLSPCHEPTPLRSQEKAGPSPWELGPRCAPELPANGSAQHSKAHGRAAGAGGGRTHVAAAE